MGTLYNDWYRVSLSGESVVTSGVLSTAAEAVLVFQLPWTGWKGQGLDLRHSPRV